MRKLGISIFTEVWNINDSFFLENNDFSSILEKICEFVDATVVKKDYHRFDNNGLTVSYILAESSLILHTWPEFNSLTIDLFMCCKEIEVSGLENIIKKFLSTDSIKSVKFERRTGKNGKR